MPREGYRFDKIFVSPTKDDEEDLLGPRFTGKTYPGNIDKDTFEKIVKLKEKGLVNMSILLNKQRFHVKNILHFTAGDGIYKPECQNILIIILGKHAETRAQFLYHNLLSAFQYRIAKDKTMFGTTVCGREETVQVWELEEE